MTALAPTLQTFFTDRLIRQRQASPHTITAYRNTWRLLIVFTAQRLSKAPSRLDVADLDAPLIAAFLDHLEHDRGNSARTRNARLAAIHSLFRFAALRHPEHAADIDRVLAIPSKRADRALVTYLTEPELDALLASPDRGTPTGRRDHALILLAAQTGLRASELTSLTCADVHFGAGAHVSCRDKGRKDRITPLTAGTVAVLRVWTTERAGIPTDPLFPAHRGQPLSLDALERRVAHHAQHAARTCPTLKTKKITPHTLRHTAAMQFARRGRHHRDRALARPRIRANHPNLPARRHHAQRASTEPDHPPDQRPRPLPATRPASRIPRSAVIIPTRPTRAPPPTSTDRTKVGIIRRSG
jgi:integrase/recombinase XerD